MHSKFLSIFIVLLFPLQIIAQEPIKVGVILPLSGPGSSLGEASRNGITLALESLPENIRSQMQVHFEDDQLKSVHAVSAFQRLVNTRDIDIAYNISSGTANAISPLAERNKIPFVSVASDYNVVKAKKYSVALWVTPEEESKVLVP